MHISSHLARVTFLWLTNGLQIRISLPLAFVVPITPNPTAYETHPPSAPPANTRSLISPLLLPFPPCITQEVLIPPQSPTPPCPRSPPTFRFLGPSLLSRQVTSGASQVFSVFLFHPPPIRHSNSRL